MTAKEKERMLRTLPNGSAVTIINCSIRISNQQGVRILETPEGIKMIDLIGYKRYDRLEWMCVIVGGVTMNVPYTLLNCTAIQVLDTICPDDVYGDFTYGDS